MQPDAPAAWNRRVGFTILRDTRAILIFRRRAVLILDSTGMYERQKWNRETVRHTTLDGYPRQRDNVMLRSILYSERHFADSS